MIYKAGKRTGVENDNFIYFNLSAGTYSIDNFNAKIKLAILQQSQDWEPHQIKDLPLVIPEDYTLMACNSFFIAHGMPILKRLCQSGQGCFLAHAKHLSIHHLLQYLCHHTVRRSTRSKTSWMDNRQVCWPACEIEAYFFSDIEVRGQNAKKKKKHDSIQ